MSKFLLFIVLLAFSTLSQLKAQAVDRVLGAGFITQAVALQQLSNQRWLVVGTGNKIPGGTYSDTLFCAVFNNEGSLLYRHNLQLPSAEAHSLDGVTALPDGGYVLVFVLRECDTGGYQNTTQRFNSAGQLLWQRQSGLSFGGFLPPKLYNTPDGNLIGIFNKTIYKISLADGTTIWKGVIPLAQGSYFSSYTFATNTEDLIGTGSMGIQYWERTSIFDQTANYSLKNTTSSSNYGAMRKILIGPDNTCYAFKYDLNLGDIFLRFNPLGHTVDTLPIAGDNWKDYTVNTDGIWVLYQHLEDLQLKHFNFSGQLLSSFSRQDPWLGPSFFGVSDNRVFIVGVAGSGPLSDLTKSAYYDRFDTGHLWTRSVPLSEFESNISTPNAGAIDAVRQAAISIDTFLSSNGNYYHLNGGNFSVKVKNNGAQVLNKVDVLIGFELSTHSICYFRPSKRIQFTGLNLAPGASTWVDFGDISARYQNSIPTQFCFWTAAPNNLPDADHNDDTYCLDFQTTATVEPPRSDVQAYPNPASDGIWIQTGAGVGLPEHYALFDMLGREVLQGAIPKGTDRYFISMEGQNEGFFILKTGDFVQKIIIKR